MIEMALSSIRVQMPDNLPVVLLREAGKEGGRTLPILIGHEEATAIARAVQGIEPARPLTHDLMRDLLTTLGVELEAVVVTELRDRIFYAEIRMKRDGAPFVVSARPSDAIALAVRTGTTIYVADEELLDKEGYVLQDDDEQEEVIEEFQKFIEQVRPEDFAS